jgi:hypothetical protein
VLAHIIALKGAVAAVEAPDVSNSLSRLEVQARNRATGASIAAFAMVQALTERLIGELAPMVPSMDKQVEVEAQLSDEITDPAPLSLTHTGH